jgi:hypothetical protein
LATLSLTTPIAELKLLSPLTPLYIAVPIPMSFPPVGYAPKSSQRIAGHGESVCRVSGHTGL